MDILRYKNFEGTAELDMSRNVCRGKILFISDLVTYEAATPRELQKEFEAAVDDYLETCGAIGKEPERPLKGMFNVRISPSMHKEAVIRAAKEDISLNELVTRSINAYLCKSSHSVTVQFMKVPADTPMKIVSTSAPGNWGVLSNVH